MASSNIDTTLATAFYNLAQDFGTDAQLVQIRDQALSQITTGQYGLLTSLTVNGKTAQYQNPVTPFDVLKSVQLALKWYADGTVITSEVPDFRFLF